MVFKSSIAIAAPAVSNDYLLLLLLLVSFIFIYLLLKQEEMYYHIFHRLEKEVWFTENAFIKQEEVIKKQRELMQFELNVVYHKFDNMYKIHDSDVEKLDLPFQADSCKKLIATYLKTWKL